MIELTNYVLVKDGIPVYAFRTNCAWPKCLKYRDSVRLLAVQDNEYAALFREIAINQFSDRPRPAVVRMH